jgi:oxygen-independent coproporphyrinogen-3 oxidase
VREIEQVAAAAPAALGVATVFFGGGTPSLLALAQLGDVLAALRRSFALAPDCEITLEANPGTVDPRYLEGLVALGVNRISFGVQSAAGRARAARAHSHLRRGRRGRGPRAPRGLQRATASTST